MRDFFKPHRSLAYGTRGMAATSHPLATLAALDALKAGGTAVDAAITASATLAVVEPHSTGIGGDCFAILWRERDGLRGLNGSGRSPARLDADRLIGGPPLADTSPLTVTVPGAIDAWDMLMRDYGKLGLERALQPAIDHAEDGFVVTPRVAFDWSDQVPRLERSAGSRQQLLIGGKPPAEGDRIRLPQLARTLRAIAKHGRDAFYEGEIADDIVRTLNAGGSAMSAEDLARHKGQWVDPITADYGGLDIAEIPPNGHGVTALIIMSILKRLEDRGGEAVSAKRYHLLMEAARLAYAVRNTFVADPEKADVPIEHLLSDALADELAQRIDPRRRRDDLGPVPRPRRSDTIYLSVVDGDGLAVSFINSVYFSFGTGLTTEKTGIWLQNRGLGFSLERGHPNVIAPGKRPLHTIIPGMALRHGKPEIVFGVMGGHFQPVGHATAITNMLDHGLDAQAALDSPRVFFDPNGLALERGVPESVKRDLEGMGHTTVWAAEPFGGGQIIAIDRKTGVLRGGSDPRKDGFAAGL
jgi:gamma-glutamyltranspeptidase/glutathione hydrolase